MVCFTELGVLLDDEFIQNEILGFAQNKNICENKKQLFSEKIKVKRQPLKNNLARKPHIKNPCRPK